MTRREVVVKAFAGLISWVMAATLLGVTERHMRRIKARFEQFGVDGLLDLRGGRPRARRVSVQVIAELCRLKRDVYPDFSMKHFHEKATSEHGLKLSYTLARSVLQDAGLVEKAPGRGKYRRKRERRPLRGMLVHLDASTHAWVADVPPQDLVVAMDDADGRILFARFFPQEGTHSTLIALRQILEKHGRFAELYTDRGSHFCRTPKANGPSVTDGQVSRVCKVLGIRQILAHSPQARGRSERCFGTLQGRLPQELRVAGVRTYDEANAYLEQRFIADFNERFTVTPALPESGFVRLVGIDLDQVMSEQHERVVAADNTVSFEGVQLQLPKGTETRSHFARCSVLVHRLVDASLMVSYLGQTLARYTADGELIVAKRPAKRRKAA